MGGFCKDCKYWMWKEGQLREWRPCERFAFNSGPDSVGHRNPLRRSNKAIIIVSDRHLVTEESLLTAPDFGCVQFESRSVGGG